MGFFSDLKEDLSQAVNELMPEEFVEKPTQTETLGEPTEKNVEEEVTQAEDFSVELSLEEMLKNIDDIQLPDEENVESKVSDSDDIAMDSSLEDYLAAALAAIPDENGMSESVQTVEPIEDIVQNLSEEFEPESVMETIAEPVTEPMAETVEESVAGLADASVPMFGFAGMDMEPQVEAQQEEIKVEESTIQESAIQENTIEETIIEENKIEDKGAEEMDSYTNRQATDETAVITAGMQIKGDITSEGSVEVVGTVEGNIDILGKLNVTGHINGNSKASEIYAEGAKINGEIVSAGAVKIGNSSVIIGNITAKSAAIAGAVKGDIDVQGPVVLDASAIVMGNIKSKSVQINNGAVIEGMCSQCYADVSPTAFFDDYKPEKKKNAK